MNANRALRGLAACALLGSLETAAVLAAPAGERIPPIAAAELDRLLAEIKPVRGESPWREIPWLTSITEARRRAVAEDKPLVVFTAADGSPLGRT